MTQKVTSLKEREEDLERIQRTLSPYKDFLALNLFDKNGKLSARKSQRNFRWLEQHNFCIFNELDNLSILLNKPMNEILYLLFYENISCCKECGNGTEFMTFTRGYRDFCSTKCLNNAKNVQEKKKITCNENYGVDNPSQSEFVKEKKKITCNENYGVDFPFQSKINLKKAEETYIRKYGKKRTNLFGSNEFQENLIEKYGESSFLKTEEGRKRIKETMLEKYGVENYSQTKEYKEKIYKTKKSNNTFKKSKPEDEVCVLLKKVFDDIIRQYKSTEYPFVCDFYIPSLDLYIEYQGSWTHGKEPFDENNEEHLNIVEQWNGKAEELNFKGEKKKYYLNAIETWTKRDVEKRNHAKENNLNWAEFFSLDSLKYWLRTQNYQNIDNFLDIPDFKELYAICLEEPFPGTDKWPANHPIWDCNVANKLSPKDAWIDEKSLIKAINNFEKIWKKGIQENKYQDYIKRWTSEISRGNMYSARLILNRFTVAKIAPKVTALSEKTFIRLLKESGKNFSNGIYCPMAGFGGIVRAAKSFNIPVEAYDINQRFNDWYGWEYRNVLDQIIITDKLVAVCPPFGLNTERWPGTPDEMYYSFEEWCRLIRKHIKAPDYLFIGPEKKTKNSCGLFGKSIGVQAYYDK